jgi:hypothetical protein
MSNFIHMRAIMNSEVSVSSNIDAVSETKVLEVDEAVIDDQAGRRSHHHATLPDLDIYSQSNSQNSHTTLHQTLDENLLQEYFDVFEQLRRHYLRGDIVVLHPADSLAYYPFRTTYCCVLDRIVNMDESTTYLVFDGFEKRVVPSHELYPSFCSSNILDEYDILDILFQNNYDLVRSRQHLESLFPLDTSSDLDEEAVNVIFKYIRKEYVEYQSELLVLCNHKSILPPDADTIIDRIHSRYDFSSQRDVVNTLVAQIYHHCGLALDDYNPKSRDSKLAFVEHLLDSYGRLNRLKYVFRLWILLSLHGKGQLDEVQLSV